MSKVYYMNVVQESMSIWTPQRSIGQLQFICHFGQKEKVGAGVWGFKGETGSLQVEDGAEHCCDKFLLGNPETMGQSGTPANRSLLGSFHKVW